MIAWVYLFVAAIQQVLWIYSLKFIDFDKIKNIAWMAFFTDSRNFWALVPPIGYIIFGTGNVICFSLATKTIPTSIAFAIWMAMALVGIKIIDVIFFKESFSYLQLLYLLFILIGIIGLKKGG